MKKCQFYILFVAVDKYPFKNERGEYVLSLHFMLLI